MKKFTAIIIFMASVMVIGLATTAGAVWYAFSNTSSLPNGDVKFRAYMSVMCEGQQLNFAPNDTNTLSSCGFKRIVVFIPRPNTWNMYKGCYVTVPSHSDANFRVTFDGNLKVHYEGSGDNPPKNDYSCTPENGNWIW